MMSNGGHYYQARISDLSCQKGFDSEILQPCIAHYASLKVFDVYEVLCQWVCLWCVFVCLFVSSQFIQIQYNNNMNGQCKQWFVCKCFTLISAWSLLLWLTFIQVGQYTYFSHPCSKGSFWILCQIPKMFSHLPNKAWSKIFIFKSLKILLLWYLLTLSFLKKIILETILYEYLLIQIFTWEC